MAALRVILRTENKKNEVSKSLVSKWCMRWLRCAQLHLSRRFAPQAVSASSFTQTSSPLAVFLTNLPLVIGPADSPNTEGVMAHGGRLSALCTGSLESRHAESPGFPGVPLSQCSDSRTKAAGLKMKELGPYGPRPRLTAFVLLLKLQLEQMKVILLE